MEKIELSITDIKNKITTEINSRHGSVKAFAENKKALRRAGIPDMAPASVQSLLAGGGSTSFKLYQKLWKYLDLGKLDKVITRKITYYEQPSKADIHQEQ